MWLLERRLAASTHLDTHTFTERRALVAAKECDLERPRPSATHGPGAVADPVTGSSIKGPLLFSKYSPYFSKVVFFSFFFR